MNDYISRQAAIDETWKEPSYADAINVLTEVRDRIKRIPSADVRENVMGVWEEKPDPYGFFKTIPVCSACGCIPKFREVSLFCPTCGADMRGNDDE